MLGPTFAFYGLIVLVCIHVIFTVMFLRNEKRIQRAGRHSIGVDQFPPSTMTPEQHEQQEHLLAPLPETPPPASQATIILAPNPFAKRGESA